MVSEFKDEKYHYSRALGIMDPSVLLKDEAFNRHSYDGGEHVSPYAHGDIDVGVDELWVRMVQGIDERAFQETLARAQKATIGLPEDDDIDVSNWEELMKGGLQTALESQVVVFEVFRVARATTHQLVRSRRAAFHQQSMRASYMGDYPNVRMPESIWRSDRAREAFEAAIKAAHYAYRVACEEDISYQDARYILPIGTETYIMCEYSVREFLAVYAYRACSMFQWEICHVVRTMGAILGTAYPWLKPYIKISCETTGPVMGDHGTTLFPHRCTFQGWEDVELGCDFPWAKHEARVYQPTAYRIRSSNKEQQ